jgi:hypothetical protein
MLRRQIMEQALWKALKNGYSGLPFGYAVATDWQDQIDDGRYLAIIFSHDFAKAFWKDETKITHRDGIPTIQPGWQYHLQQMVLETNPLAYLERFLD